MTTALERYRNKYAAKPEVMTLDEYLEACKTDKDIYLNPAERLLKAIGEPVILNTRDDPALSRLYDNRKILTYPTINASYIGQYDVIANVVSFIKSAARGLEASKQILYLLGPVGGGKSTLAEILKRLMETQPFYALAVDDKDGLRISPIHENPLGLFSTADSDDLQIAPHYLLGKHSPWAHKRLIELEGDISKFKVVKLYPDEARHIAIAKTEPGDENTQDISALVGKLDISKAALMGQSDPDCYEFSGSLCRGNRGIMEFVEMFKAPIKMLHSLLTATQEHNYNPTEQFPSIPHEGIILAHSNEAEWETFRNNKANEAFIDRTYVVKVPYELRKDYLIKIYQQELNKGALKDKPMDPQVLDILATFQLSGTLTDPEDKSNTNNKGLILTKIRTYNGENVKDEDPGAKSYQEHRESEKNAKEGMESLMSTRTSFKTLSGVFDCDPTEVSASSVDLLLLLEKYIKKSDLPADARTRLENNHTLIQQKFIEQLQQHIHDAYLGKYSAHGQKMFERYVSMADAWLNHNDYTADDGARYNRDMLNSELSKVEKPADITNPTDHRREVVNFVLRRRAENNGKHPNWQDHKTIAKVFEKSLLADFPNFVPVILDGKITSEDDAQRLDTFYKNMKELGYSTERMIKRAIDFWSRKRTV